MLKVENDKFVKDIEFDIIPSQICEWWAVYKASDATVVKGDIPDIELDISDISPSIFLACINNSYARGFSSCVGLDMTLDSFSKYMIKITNFQENNYLGFFDTFKELLIKYDQTGKIHTREWNILAKQDGHIWTHHEDIMNDSGAIIATNTIEEIVKTARKLHAKYAKNNLIKS